MSSRVAAVIALLALACAAAMSPATASGASRACGAMEGKTVVKTPSIRVVSRTAPGRKRNEPSTTTYYGCDRTTGPVRRLGDTAIRNPSGTNRRETTFGIVKTAGRFVLFSQFEQDSGGGTQQHSRVVIDLRSGSRREVWRFVTLESTLCEEEGKAYFPRPKQFVLGANGVVAGVYVPAQDDKFRECFTPSDASVVLVSVPGQSKLRELDRGPVADIPSRSLKLTGRTVSWTHGAERRSATV
jgi:hypothetical protein